MDHHQIARLLAAGRLVTGIALMCAPRAVARRWIGPVGADRQATIMTRAMGARDAVLGAGALRALRRGEPAGPWVLGGAMADGVDAVATVAGVAGADRAARRQGLPVVVIAVVAAIGGVVTARGLESRQ